MPSAAAKPSNGLAAEPQEGIVAQCLAVADKKVRNLEKRRSKLQQLRDDEKGGKELNEEQRDAISRMEQVELMLDVSKEIQKQYKQLADQFEKVSRRNVRVEKAARRDADLALVAKVIRIQSVMDGVTAESREDFKSGSNQACKLSEKELDQLDTFYSLTKPQRAGEAEENFAQAVAKGSDHLLLFVERSGKDVAGADTTYEQLAAVVDQIEASGYLNVAKEEAAAEVADVPAAAEYSPVAEVQQTDSAPAAAALATAVVEEPVAVADAAPSAVADSPSGKPPMIGFLHESTVQTRGGEQVPAAVVAMTSSQDVAAATSEQASGVENTPPAVTTATATTGGEPSAWGAAPSGADGNRQPRHRSNNGGRGGPRGGRGARGGSGAGRGGRDFHRDGGEGGYRGNQERRGGGFNQRGGGRGGPRGGRGGGNPGPRRGGSGSGGAARPSGSGSGGDYQGSF